MTEEEKASPELRIFFDRLLSLKKRIGIYAGTGDKILEIIYDELDNIIKEV
jgi:hypothetical protein